ncbi:MAG: TatD family hydrolase [Candidatus Neomarinimicrobiota bacterium]|nr:TatD family hydrolase [Candidatus Neomarinimicrobiota bacterium]
MIIDAHCHLYYDELASDIDNVIQRAIDAGVSRFVCVGTNVEDSKKCLSITENNDDIFASSGVHPHDSKDTAEGYTDEIYELMEYESMIAIGEIGLDYYRNLSEPETQKKVFKELMEVAQDLDKPVIIHNRDADADTLEIIGEYPNVQGVAHCFSSTIETAQAFLEMGYYISFSGNITYKNSHLPEIVKSIPLDRIVVETDSPYLSPEPERGKPNEPSRIIHTLSKLSEIYGLSFEEMAKHTYDNTTELFRLP